MDGFGTMREKLDIKILILFILRRLPGTVSESRLSEYVTGDGTVGYFEYAECLAELVDSAHIERTAEGCRITGKGDRNCETVESTLPYSIRSRVEKKIAPYAEVLRRQALIKAEHTAAKDGYHVALALSDGIGSIMEMKLVCGSEEHALTIEKNFRARAESYYTEFTEMLLKGEG